MCRYTRSRVSKRGTHSWQRISLRRDKTRGSFETYATNMYIVQMANRLAVGLRLAGNNDMDRLTCTWHVVYYCSTWCTFQGWRYDERFPHCVHHSPNHQRQKSHIASNVCNKERRVGLGRCFETRRKRGRVPLLVPTRYLARRRHLVRDWFRSLKFGKKRSNIYSSLFLWLVCGTCIDPGYFVRRYYCFHFILHNNRLQHQYHSSTKKKKVSSIVP